MSATKKKNIGMRRTSAEVEGGSWELDDRSRMDL